ncbi:hypothetical protein YC2023_085290 [Brassica napus]
MQKIFEKKTKIALNQVFVPKLALKAKNHKNSIQVVGFRVWGSNPRLCNLLQNTGNPSFKSRKEQFITADY